jgi:hypothetical protein
MIQLWKISSVGRTPLIRTKAKIKTVSEIYMLEIPEHRVIRDSLSIKTPKVFRSLLIR